VWFLYSYLALSLTLLWEVDTEFENASSQEQFVPIDNALTEGAEAIKSSFEIPLENLEPTITNHSKLDTKTKDAPLEVQIPKEEIVVETKKVTSDVAEKEVAIEVEKVTEEEVTDSNKLANKLVEDFGEFDPTLELSNYKFPPLDLLKQYNTEGITINQEELEENKNRIVETLNNYKIGISSIKATIGPTVTLYEIVPEAGVRISKIKNLEDDIALSLSALGIRIIAPIPGKGTIGIEVPNKNSTIVSMHSVIASKKFQESKMQLPIALGKKLKCLTCLWQVLLVKVNR